MVKPLDLGSMPFYWRTKICMSQAPLDVPNRLPFAFGFDADLQLVIQQRNDLVLRWLERVYTENANVGYLQEGHALAHSYGGEFLDFFQRASRMLSKSPTSAADIGCGGVYLLQLVRALGLSVKGIDPSPVTAAAGEKAGIEIIQSFYPTPVLDEQFDILFHYDVLEHVEDPVAFLRAHHKNLSPGGCLVFAVPDCTDHIELGDVSMALHEHLNYFDETSLANTVRAAGFELILLEAARHGGVLMCCAVPAIEAQATTQGRKKDSQKFTDFANRAQKSMSRFLDIASRATGRELGLYVPLRAFPYLSGVTSGTHLRFFDDDPGLLGRYFDGFDVAIENRAGLEKRPPAHLIICSLSFGDQIAQRLSIQTKGNLSLTRWTDLFVKFERKVAGRD
jgi:2-polyprenyl-3-methyl-5-hydroxy-6-metoxy-1,4-benzoquinol methylase